MVFHFYRRPQFSFPHFTGKVISGKSTSNQNNNFKQEYFYIANTTCLQSKNDFVLERKRKAHFDSASK